jgi:hypothetical protein
MTQWRRDTMTLYLHLQFSPGKVTSNETPEPASLHIPEYIQLPNSNALSPRLALGVSYFERDLVCVHKLLLCHGVDIGEDKRKPGQVCLELWTSVQNELE